MQLEMLQSLQKKVEQAGKKVDYLNIGDQLFFPIPETANEIASFSFSSLLFINPIPGVILDFVIVFI